MAWAPLTLYSYPRGSPAAFPTSSLPLLPSPPFSVLPSFTPYTPSSYIPFPSSSHPFPCPLFFSISLYCINTRAPFLRLRAVARGAPKTSSTAAQTQWHLESPVLKGSAPGRTPVENPLLALAPPSGITYICCSASHLPPGVGFHQALQSRANPTLFLATCEPVHLLGSPHSHRGHSEHHQDNCRRQPVCASSIPRDLWQYSSFSTSQGEASLWA